MLDHANVLMAENILQELFLSFHYVTAKGPSWSTGLEGTDGVLLAPKDTDLTCLCKCYTLQEAFNKGIALPLLSKLLLILFSIFDFIPSLTFAYISLSSPILSEKSKVNVLILCKRVSSWYLLFFFH